MTIEYFRKNWKNIKEEDINFTEEEWLNISSYQYLSEDFIERYQDKVDWYSISYFQVLSEEFIEKHKKRVYWSGISRYQSLSEEFIEKYKHLINWPCVSKYQLLSEEFIEKHIDEVDWYCISRRQSLSEEFIYKHKDKISHLNCLDKHYRLRFYRLRYRKYYTYTSFSIHTNNNYGLIICWEDEMNIQTIPSNIIFCHTL